MKQRIIIRRYQRHPGKDETWQQVLVLQATVKQANCLVVSLNKAEMRLHQHEGIVYYDFIVSYARKKPTHSR